MKLSRDEIEAAREQIMESNEVKPPTNNLEASRTINDWTQSPNRTTIQPLNGERARRIRWEEIKLGRSLTAAELKKF